ncbi:MAG: cob(I)yrinic acid a,c-diamide adenosyltransferase [Candidatus Omnitrophica bacterium]|nr:cob(I)yrinic acid a,c-diamide adenosyltransferase [Candidatus Omnitrophota bacterium]
MSISTRKGDKGKTSLFDGTRVSKNDIRVEACGTLDELSAFLGVCKSVVEDPGVRRILEEVQKKLFAVGSEITVHPEKSASLSRRIDDRDVGEFDDILKRLEQTKRREEGCFSLPGATPFSAVFDLARTVARRAERRLVQLTDARMLDNPSVLAYFNRLSDILFVFARVYETDPQKFNDREIL